MKSIACISSSVMAACQQHTSTCLPWHRALMSVGRCAPVDAVVAQQPCGAAVRSLRSVRVNTAGVQQQVSAAPFPLPGSGRRVEELSVTVPGSAAYISPYSRYGRAQGSSSAQVSIQSLFEGDVIPELCSRLAGLPSSERAEGLAALLGACVESGLKAHSPLVVRLMDECLELLSSGGIGVAQLCHLGEVARALEGRRSPLATKVLESIGAAVEEEEEDAVSPREAVRVYSLLASCCNPASPQQALVLSTLHAHTLRLVHRLRAGQVSSILQSLLQLQHTQVRAAGQSRAANSHLLFVQ